MAHSPYSTSHSKKQLTGQNAYRAPASSASAAVISLFCIKAVTMAARVLPVHHTSMGRIAGRNWMALRYLLKDCPQRDCLLSNAVLHRGSGAAPWKCRPYLPPFADIAVHGALLGKLDRQRLKALRYLLKSCAQSTRLLEYQLLQD